MLTTFRYSATILWLLFCFSSCAQKEESSPKYYTIEPSIVSEINRKIEPFNGQANTNISFTVYEDGKELANSMETGEPALSFTSFTDNTIMIDCLNGIEDGFGFSLVISKDTSFLKFKVLSNSDSILFRQSDNATPQPELLVSCPSKKVTLSDQPEFANGEIIQGKVELESEPFYEISKGKERSLKFKLTGYFKSEPLPLTNNEYKTLIQVPQ